MGRQSQVLAHIRMLRVLQYRGLTKRGLSRVPIDSTSTPYYAMPNYVARRTQSQSKSQTSVDPPPCTTGTGGLCGESEPFKNHACYSTTLWSATKSPPRGRGPNNGYAPETVNIACASDA